jgi:hypothetical protein
MVLPRWPLLRAGNVFLATIHCGGGFIAHELERYQLAEECRQSAGRKGLYCLPARGMSGPRSPGRHRDCHEMCGVPAFEPHEDGMLASRSRGGYGLAHLGGCIHGLARNVENDITRTDAGLGGWPHQGSHR